jgi:hypothetical protein
VEFVASFNDMIEERLDTSVVLLFFNF